MYDPNEIMALDINSRSKVSCLKKLLLEKRGMKKANIILMRQIKVKDPNAKIVQSADSCKADPTGTSGDAGSWHDSVRP